MRKFSRFIFEISAVILLAILLWTPLSPVSGAPTDNQASVVITAMPAYTPPDNGRGNGGGAGSSDGGGIPNGNGNREELPPGSTEPDTQLSRGAVSLDGIITEDGVFTSDIIIESNNDRARLFISAGTAGIIEKTTVPHEISIVEITEVSTIPSIGSKIIGTIYDIGTSGLEFDNPVSLTLYYEDSWVPDGVSESDLYIAVNDGLHGDWQRISNSKVDPVDNKVNAMIEHFSAFTIMADIKLLLFELSKLDIYPATVTGGEVVNISLLVTNTNDTGLTRTVSLIINGQPENEKEVTLAAGESRTVTFDINRQKAGEYTVTIGTLTGIFTIKPISAEVPDSPISEEPPVNPQPEEPPVSPISPEVAIDPAQPQQSASYILYITCTFAVIAVAVLSWYYLRRKRRQNTADTDRNNAP